MLADIVAKVFLGWRGHVALRDPKNWLNASRPSTRTDSEYTTITKWRRQWLRRWIFQRVHDHKYAGLANPNPWSAVQDRSEGFREVIDPAILYVWAVAPSAVYHKLAPLFDPIGQGFPKMLRLEPTDTTVVDEYIILMALRELALGNKT